MTPAGELGRRPATHTPLTVEIRLLTAADAAEARALRLRALQENPEAFGSTYADEVDRPVEATAARLADPASGFVLGAAVAGGPLAGVVGCYREGGRKRRHVAVVWGMFVAPEARGQGAGRLLLDAAVERAAAWPGVEQLTLTVVPENAAARALYVSSGFRPFGLEPRAMRDDVRHYDLEYLWLPLVAR
jgi:GNAT superfamily N-acetyltransferase